MVSRLFGGALLAVVTAVASHAQAPARNVILITIDGLRWQEFFTGADRDYFKRDKAGAAESRAAVPARPEERRAVLMPFVWKTLAAAGRSSGMLPPATVAGNGSG